MPIDYPGIINDALQELGSFSEELTRKIDSLIQDICRRCGKAHYTVMLEPTVAAARHQALAAMRIITM